ncbi:replicative DNA helicase [Candidatus Poseidoniales archaeon]|nr:replicative DNA helicase [Candidatus Poseidoniales archaeon]
MDNIYELEANIIGSMVLDYKRFQSAQEKGLMPDDFDVISYKNAYEIMIRENANDIVTIRTNMDNDIMFKEVQEASAYCVSSAGFEGWIDLMQDKSANNKLLRLAEEIPRIVGEKISIAEKIDTVNQLLIDNKITKNNGTPREIKDILETVHQELKNAGTNLQNIVKTGFTQIDKKIRGFKPGDLVIVAGRPGMGKTTWALNIATNNIFAHKNVLIFSLEMTNEQLIKKIVSSESGISIDKMDGGNLTASDWRLFEETKNKLSQSNLYVYDKSPITIETLVNKTKSIQAVKQIDLIIVDYLQLLMTTSKAPAGSDNRTASMTYISNLLKGLAKEIGCPLISLSQLNRGVESRPDKRPLLSDLRDSGSIEQDADMVIMLYREDYYDALDTGLSEVIVKKNRMGEMGTFELSFDGSLSKFIDPEDRAFGRKKEYGPI